MSTVAFTIEKLVLSPAVIIWHKPHKWTSEEGQGHSSDDLDNQIVSERQIVIISLLSIQIGTRHLQQFNQVNSMFRMLHISCCNGWIWLLQKK